MDYTISISFVKPNSNALNLLESASSRTLPDPFIQGRDTRNRISRVHRNLGEVGLGRSRQRGSRVDGVEGTGHLARIRVAVGSRYRRFRGGVNSTLAFDQ